MRLVHALWFQLRGFLRRQQVNAEVEEELAFHIERETEANQRRGLPDAEARRLALARFGGVERFKEACRDERATRWVDDVTGDARHAVRLVRKNALYSATVVATLALGIGATSTIFAIVNRVLLRPLPYPEAERIVAISESSGGIDRAVVGERNYRQWRSSSRTLSSIALHAPSTAVLTGAGNPQELAGARATASLFRVLGTGALLGRTFRDDEELPGSAPVVLLSHALWVSRFGSDTGIVGRQLTLNGISRTVAGVMPASFAFPGNVLYWTPFSLPVHPAGDRSEFFFRALARIRPNASLAAVRADLQRLIELEDVSREPPQRGANAIVLTLHERLFGSVKRPLSLLLGAVVLLLLVACANVANLTLARSASRSREFAVRLALGAGRWRLARQLFVESALLAVMGGTAGALVPVLLVGALVKLSPASVAGVSDIRVDGTVLLFTLVITLITAVLFGLAPAMMAYRSAARTTLTGASTRSTSTRSHRMLRSTLVVAEVAAALILLTGAGLITRSFTRALAIDPGFRPQQVTAAYASLPRSRYPSMESRLAYYERLSDALRTVPEVEAVATGDALPMFGFSMTQPIRRLPTDPSAVETVVSTVSLEYPRVLGMRLRRGRLFDANDRRGTPLVALLSASAARQLFPERDALGQSVQRPLDATVSSQLTVVGIVDDVVQQSAEAKPMPHLFIPSTQGDGYPDWLIVRSRLEPQAMQAALSRIALTVDPLQPISKFVSLPEVISKELAPRRLNSVVINAFAWLALLLSMIGLYGVMTQTVASRTQELGIRMALGAGHAAVIRLMLRQAVALSALGIVIGITLSFALTRTLDSMLFDVGAHDPLVFALAPTVLAFVALCACYAPARRATRVDPLVALRSE